MHRRFAVVLILLLFGFGVMAERFDLLPLHVKLVIDARAFAPATKLRTAETAGQEGGATPKIAIEGSPEQAADSIAAVTAAGEAKPQAAKANPENPEIDQRPPVSLDVARISRDGPSVFAGKAAPFAEVTVLDGATPVATATALSNGDWSVVTDHKFASLNPQINLRAVDGSEKKPDALAGHDGHRSTAAINREATRPEAATPDVRDLPVPADATPPSVELIKEFENVVAAAREEAKQRDSAVSPVNGAIGAPAATPATPSVKALSTTSPPAAAESPPATQIGPDSTRLPAVTTTVPMTFVYDEATLTAEGNGAAQLLLEYLKLKQFSAVTLSGHADERGSPAYNMDLSRQRLDTIMRALRAGGYQGKIDLLPKGASEPFAGVDRSRFPREELMQLDRRVEVRVAK